MGSTKSLKPQNNPSSLNLSDLLAKYTEELKKLEKEAFEEIKAVKKEADEIELKRLRKEIKGL